MAVYSGVLMRLEMINEAGELLASGSGEDLVKSHVKGYTRKDGTFVQEHDDKRKAAQYDHPSVVGKISSHKVIGDKGRGTKDGNGDPTHSDTTSIGFAGRDYAPTGKTGQSLHDKTPVHEFEADDGHRVWADGAGRVHADSQDEVESLRAAHEKHAGGEKAGGDPKEGEVGHHELKTYGVYHQPGSKVRDSSGKTHVVREHRGASVTVEDSQNSFHPTKLKKIGADNKTGKREQPLKKALLFGAPGLADRLPKP
jgi:hypothetical protein